MSRFADPIVSLYSEPVALSYIKSFLDVANISYVLLDDGIPCIRLGAGSDGIVMLTGFTAHDYKITNTLILMSYCAKLSIRPLPTFSTSTISSISLNIVPIVNLRAYRDIKVSLVEPEVMILDENNVNVFRDFLTLRSRYTRSVHKFVRAMKPRLVLTIFSERLFGKQCSKILICAHRTQESAMRDLLRELEEHGLEADLHVYNVSDLQLPHVHFFYENVPSLGVVIPSRLFVEDIALGLSIMISRILRRCESLKTPRDSSRSYECLMKIGSQEIVEVLRDHDIHIERSGDHFRAVYDGSNMLAEILLSSRFIESYFNVTVVECRPIN